MVNVGFLQLVAVVLQILESAFIDLDVRRRLVYRDGVISLVAIGVVGRRGFDGHGGVAGLEDGHLGAVCGDDVIALSYFIAYRGVVESCLAGDGEGLGVAVGDGVFCGGTAFGGSPASIVIGVEDDALAGFSDGQGVEGRRGGVVLHAVHAGHRSGDGVNTDFFERLFDGDRFSLSGCPILIAVSDGVKFIGRLVLIGFNYIAHFDDLVMVSLIAV